MNIIITGASRGIGKAVAMLFAEARHTLFLNAKKADTLQSTGEEISRLYPASTVHLYAADLSVKEKAKAFGEFCLLKGIPDILFNNAGVYIPGSCIDEPEGSLELMMNINLYSAYHLTRALIPAMIKNKKGHIFNNCSIASLDAYDGGGGYSISKFAMNGFSKNLRHELKPHGIKVTAVFSGAILTDSWKGFDNSNNRIMEANDLAKMIIASTALSPQAVVEEIRLRPLLGDL